MAYVRTKTIRGKTYRYLVKSVREGKRVRQVFVSYIGNPPPASARASQNAVAGETRHGVETPLDFTPLVGADVRVRYVMLLRQLGCQSVVFSLRAKHKHGEMQGLQYPETGEIVITKVRLHRDASAAAIAHEVGHVLDALLQNADAAGGSRHADFLSYSSSLRHLADYTCAHHETSSPDFVRQLKGRPVSAERQRNIRRLKRYYESYVYQPEELLARLVAVSFTEPDKAKAIAPGAYAWLQDTLGQHECIRAALIQVGLWSQRQG